MSLRELELGSGNQEVTTEEPISTSSPIGSIWSLSNVVVLQSSTSGKKKRGLFDPDVEFNSTKISVNFVTI
jgi:hypothetical protein